ncbi:MAG: acetyl-CoA carboxylase biotin carboxyl carrier protein [Planctomycetes bacterium]|nr:acetyl-CoA carboxylase biotin carboxyl carrier protein [Planctomycetota bacterium]
MAKETFTDNKRVRELVKLMTENDLSEIELTEDKAKIRLKRETLPGSAPPIAVPAAPAARTAGASAAAISTAHEEENLIPLKSPMVGSFYGAANPDAEPYVKVGSAIQKDTVVCIIEAMKVFNEIRADMAGVIAKILVRNGQAVEYNQPLFLVRPE